MLIILQDTDLDHSTARLNDKNQVIAVTKFTDKEVTVPANQITNLLFRGLESSNRSMVCTGVELGGQWYGDRPDDGAYIDALDGMKIKYFGEPPAVKTQFIVKEGYQGLDIYITNIDDQPNFSVAIQGIGNQGHNWKREETVKGYHLHSNSVRMAFSESLGVELFLPDGSHYTAEVPRKEFNNSLGTYMFEAVGANNLHGILDQFTLN